MIHKSGHEHDPQKWTGTESTKMDRVGLKATEWQSTSQEEIIEMYKETFGNI